MFDADLNERQSRIDRVQLVALVGLMLLGATFVYSATMVSESARLAPWYNQRWFTSRIIPHRYFSWFREVLRGRLQTSRNCTSQVGTGVI